MTNEQFDQLYTTIATGESIQRRMYVMQAYQLELIIGLLVALIALCIIMIGLKVWK